MAKEEGPSCLLSTQVPVGGSQGLMERAAAGVQRGKPGAAGRPRCKWSSTLERARARGRESLRLPGSHCSGFPLRAALQWVRTVWVPRRLVNGRHLLPGPFPHPCHCLSIPWPRSLASGWLAVGAGEYLSAAKHLNIIIGNHSCFTGNGAWNLGKELDDEVKK